MIPPLRTAHTRAALLTQFGPLLLLAAGLFAYRAVLPAALGWPSRAGFEDWLFAPDQKTPFAALALAAWLLWRRHARLQALPGRAAPRTACALLALGTACFAWTLLHPSEHLLLLSLAANLLAYAAATKGRAGVRALLLPALVVLLGAPIPAPIRDELVWQLQLWATGAAAWLLHLAGFDVEQSGILLRRGPHVFAVIASCSGLRGMEVLTLVALAIRERFAASGRRQWLLVLAAPALALALNLARILVVIVIASSAEPQPPESGVANHALQGLVLLLAGTGLLYGLGRWLAGSARGARGRVGQVAQRPTGSDGASAWQAAAFGLALLMGLSLAVAPASSGPAVPAQLELPLQHAGWKGVDLGVDRAFFGPLSSGQALHRRYERGLSEDGDALQVVDVLVGLEQEGSPGTSGLFSSRSAVPGREWSLAPLGSTRVAGLALDADVGVASREGEQALVYSWRLHDGGLWRETARAVLAFDAGPFRRDGRRAVVRLSTSLEAPDREARQRAMWILDRFASDFRDELAGL